MDMTAETQERLQTHYPEVRGLLEPDVLSALASASQVYVPVGTQVFRESERCTQFMWLLEGTVRVFKHSPAGREITLYRVKPGELCVLSLQCLICGEGYPAEAVAETDLVGLTLSQRDFDSAIDTCRDFRRYLLKVLSHRIGDVVRLVSEVTFQRLELRLACLLGQLFERSGGEPVLKTHAEVARELGTTREMVSRILKDLEHQQCIKLSRGKIYLVSEKELSGFSRA